MNEQDLASRARAVLERTRQSPADEQLQRLIDAGVIDEQGQVLLWDFDLGVIAVKPNGDGKTIDYFRCLKPHRNHPGAGEVDVSRETLLSYLTESKRVVTAYLNEEQQRWKENADVRLTADGYLRTDANDAEQDDLGELPTFSTVRNGQ